jgi:hypothetical protein
MLPQRGVGPMDARLRRHDNKKVAWVHTCDRPPGTGAMGASLIVPQSIDMPPSTTWIDPVA